MKVIFSHGKESGPWGSKIRKLAEIAQNLGYSVDSIDYSDMDNPDRRVDKLIKILATTDDKVVLVGSSMGGYVSMVAAQEHTCEGIFLLAPALYMPNYAIQSYSPNTQNLCIVHGLGDEVIPYQHSAKYAQQSKCELHLIEGDHRLNSSLDEVSEIYTAFLTQFE
ncbi:YqiA/YcfP family alpha/beta fold hydrolase [Aliiglaciecola sp. SL4]|uniref:YqiA/YcfP family alpha/beta fold hydrolase n=1 Tax=Aliiglaciecola sp. SL4 TaxID=3239806 RepID=UPI00355C1A06